MQKILTIVTSDARELNGHKTGVWLPELTHFLDVVERSGYEVDLASPRGGPVPLDVQSIAPEEPIDPINARYMADQRFIKKLAWASKCSEVDAASYVALYLAGGHGTMFDFRQSTELQRLITEFYSAGKFVAAVCHGVSGLLDSADKQGNGILRGRRVTGFSNREEALIGTTHLMPFSVEDELKRSGATFCESESPLADYVQVDGPLITGSNPESTRSVGEKLVQCLRQDARKEV